jgi:hypothetical protein
MATRETIIKVQLENQDAIRQLGKWEAELVAVRKETTALNKEVRLNDGATAEQERRLGELRSTAKNLSGNIRELSNETSGLTAAGMRFRDKMADATLEAIKQSGVLGQLAARSDTLTKEIADLNASYKSGTITQQQYTAQQEKLQSELGQTTAKMTAMDKKLDELNKDFKEGRITAEKFKAGVQSVNTEVGKGSGAFTKGVTDLKQYALGFVGIVAAAQAVGAVIGSAATIITDFDSAQSNLAAILNTNKEGISALTEEAKQYGATTAFTATQVSELQTELAKLGFTQDQIKAATPAVLDLAAATGTDLANAATIAAQTLNAFQLSAEETGRVVDVIAQSANLSALDIDTFSAAMSDAAPAAAAVGMSIEETTAMLSALVDAGIPAEKAGTDLRNIFIKLADSGMTLEEAYAEIKGSQDQLTTSVGLFDTRAAGSALILANNTEKLARLKEGYEGAAGAADAMAKTQLDNLKGDQLLLQSAWEGFVLSVEDGSGVIGKAFRGLNTMLAQMLESITSVSNKELEDYTDAVRKAAEKSKELDGIILDSTAAQEIIEKYQRQVDALKSYGTSVGEIMLQEEELAKLQARLAQLTGKELTSKGKIEKVALQVAIERYQQQIKSNKAENDNAAAKKEAARIQAEAAEEDRKAAEAAGIATTATTKQSAAIRVLADDLRAFIAAQKAINEGQGIGMMDVITPGASPIPAPEDRMLPGAVPAEDRAENIELMEEELRAATELANGLQALSDAVFANSERNLEQRLREGEISQAQFDKEKKRLDERKAAFKVFAIAETGIATYLAATKALAEVPFPANLIASAAIIANGVANLIRIQGFAQGGRVKQTDGPRYTQNPGDSVLISAAPGEVVMTREQQRRANMAAGFDVFRAARVPGFAAGGMVGNTRVRRVEAQGIIARPTPSDLNSTRNAFQQAPIFVRVSEINAVQGTVARITERASL